MAKVDLSSGGFRLWRQGAEAKLYTGSFLGRPAVAKERFAKKYRHPQLDAQLTRDRIKGEVRSIARCQSLGIRTPGLYLADLDSGLIIMEHLQDAVTAREVIQELGKKGEDVSAVAAAIGSLLGRMHAGNVIHGDLTTSNILVEKDKEGKVSSPPSLVAIDFGLGFSEGSAEDKGVDLYVLERAFVSTHPNTEEVFADAVVGAYRRELADRGVAKRAVKEVMDKFEEIRMRGRKRTMVG